MKNLKQLHVTPYYKLNSSSGSWKIIQTYAFDDVIKYQDKQAVFTKNKNKSPLIIKMNRKKFH